MIRFVQGFTYLKDIHKYYEMSYLSLLYPSLRLGYDALSSLYDGLRRRQAALSTKKAGKVPLSNIRSTAMKGGESLYTAI